MSKSRKSVERPDFDPNPQNSTHHVDRYRAIRDRSAVMTLGAFRYLSPPATERDLSAILFFLLSKWGAWFRRAHQTHVIMFNDVKQRRLRHAMAHFPKSCCATFVFRNEAGLVTIAVISLAGVRNPVKMPA
jgi:hypothetical protein